MRNLRELIEQYGDDAMLTRREAGKIMCRSDATLGRWARLGIGPKPVVINGRPLYPIKAIRAVTSEISTAA